MLRGIQEWCLGGYEYDTHWTNILLSQTGSSSPIRVEKNTYFETIHLVALLRSISSIIAIVVWSSHKSFLSQFLMAMSLYHLGSFQAT